jgi:hypothetical protein
MTLTALGLLLNVIGTVMLFFFGFPQPDFTEEVGLALEDNTPASNGLTAKEYGAKIRHKRLFYKIMSYVALSLILIGFVIQFIDII